MLRRGPRQGLQQVRAAKLAFANDYYKTPLFGMKPDFVDSFWNGYEAGIPTAIARLVQSPRDPIDAETWLRVLVPLIAATLVRGPDFATRFETDELLKRIGRERGPTWITSNTNTARLLALQRVLGPIMAADWRVLHCPSREAAIVNDTGYVDQHQSGLGLHGLIFPLCSTAILSLTAMPTDYNRRILFDAGDGDWRAFISHDQIGTGALRILNERMAHTARRFVAGERERTISGLAGMMREATCPNHVSLAVLPSHRLQTVHEAQWFRLVTAIRRSAKDPRLRGFDVDWRVVADGWHPPFFAPMNLPSYNCGLGLRGRALELGMQGVPGFTD